MTLQIRPVEPADKDWITQLMQDEWGSPMQISKGHIFYPADLPGFVALKDGERAGLITYDITGDSCEVGSLNSLKPNSGAGTALIEAVKDKARQAGCKRLWLITTNDNLNALKFYQKRGFRLVAVYPNSMDQVRQLKPQVPLLGNDGIPLRDEIELEILLDS
jgi:DNA-3-methyladenine glycosylase I